MQPSVEDLNKYVGKYVNVTLPPDGDGGSGWVREIVEEKSTGSLWVVFDLYTNAY